MAPPLPAGRPARLAAWALAVAAALALLAAPAVAVTPIQPFSLVDVDLADGSEYKEGMELNSQFLLMLPLDNLLYNFRKTANLSAPGQSLGGWEDSSVEVRGQFIGHYLSALAFVAKNTGHPAFHQRSRDLVAGLREVQEAWGDGYLSAFPPSFFDRLEALQPVWAPYYVVHKILAGLLDQHQLLDSAQALQGAQGMAQYFCGRVAHVLKANGTSHWHQVLENEFGGMNDALYRLHGITGDPAHAHCAAWFDKPAFFEPLVKGDDPLPSLHANTHLAQVNGFVARAEVTGDEEAAAAVSRFFSLALSHHSFSTGGSNWYEHWYGEDLLGDAIKEPNAGASTQESCTQYNMLKIARALFTWTGDPALADYYERAILNGVIGIQKKPQAPGHLHSHGHLHAHSPAHGPARAHSHAQSQFHLRPGHHVHGRPPQEHGAVWAAQQPHKRQDPTQQPGRLLGSSWWGWLWPAAWRDGASHHGDRDAHARAAAAPQSRPNTSALAAAAAAYAKSPRPANYKVVAWPDDPAAAIRAAATGGDAPPSPGGPGVYIYMTPLGTGLSKDSRGKGWNHGWGDAFNTFWCCYGTAIESFSKLADSIYFSRMPPSAPADAAPPLPELFVTQFASSTLTWRQLGATITQDAELYSNATAAIASLRISFDTQSDTPRPFLLHWRLPAWAKASEVDLTINGLPTDACAKVAAAGGPAWGKGARFCTLGPNWQDNDLVEARLPMRIRAEQLADSRREMRALHAVMMGPLLMAGLAQDTRRLDLDPSELEAALSLPSTEGLVSLAPADDRGLLLSLGRNGSVGLARAAAATASRAVALDSTFRVVRCDGPEAGSLAGGQQGRLVAFESMSMPGHLLTAAPSTGRLALLPAGGHDAGQQCGASAASPHQAFRLRWQGPQGAAAWASGPGAALSSPEQQHALTLASAAGMPVCVGREGQAAGAGPASQAGDRLLLVNPVAPAYPKGARLLSGRNRQYLIVPIGQIMDEHYTAYFEMVAPPPAERLQPAAGGPGAGIQAA